jgi:hypothetical protein
MNDLEKFQEGLKGFGPTAYYEVLHEPNNEGGRWLTTHEEKYAFYFRADGSLQEVRVEMSEGRSVMMLIKDEGTYLVGPPVDCLAVVPSRS